MLLHPKVSPTSQSGTCWIMEYLMKKQTTGLLGSTLISVCFTFMVLAALVYVFGDLRGRAATDVTITFDQGHGLRVGGEIRCRGIVVGEVSDVRLEVEGVQVDVALALEAQSLLMREGTRWWIDRPMVEWSRVGGLDAAFSDRFIDVDPGPAGSAVLRGFTGLDEPPVLSQYQAGDLSLILMASERGSLQRGAAVLYRGVRIGTILGTDLAEDATSVEAQIVIKRRFTPLVRRNSRFFEAGAFDLDLGFTGLRARLDSLETLMVGGVSLATPNRPAEPVVSGTRFNVEPEADDDWSSWRPEIPLQK
jgi:paraquat-inducible protein B